MSALTEKYFPKVKQTRQQFKFGQKPWVTKGILKSIERQQNLFRKYVSTKSNSDHVLYKKYKNKLTHIQELAKSPYYQKLLKWDRSSSQTWKIINKILLKEEKRISLPKKINLSGKTVTNSVDICNEINAHFCNIGENMAKKFRSVNTSKEFFGLRILTSIFSEPADDYKILSIVNRLSSKNQREQ